jgi:hypothetical protein
MALTYSIPLPANGRNRSASDFATLFTDVKATYDNHAGGQSDRHKADQLVPYANLPLTTARQAQPGNQHIANDMFARMWAELVDGDYAPANFPTKVVPITLAAVNSYLNGTNPVALRLGRNDNAQIIKSGVGESIQTVGVSPGFWPGAQGEIAQGTYPFADSSYQTGRSGLANAPVTLLGPTVKISRTEQHLLSQNPPGFTTAAGLTENNAALLVQSQSTPASHMQAVAVQGQAITNIVGATNGGHYADAVGISGVGKSNTDGCTGFGGYFAGFRYTANGYAQGMEVATYNNTATDDVYTTGVSSSRVFGIRVTGYGGLKAGGADAALGGVGMQFETSNGYATGSKFSFIAGINFIANSTRDVDYDTSSTAITSHRIGGSHTYGLDTKTGAFTGAAIHLGSGQGIAFRNTADTADVLALSKNASDQILVNSVFAVDGAGNLNTPGSLRNGSLGTLLTLATGLLNPAAVGAGTLPSNLHSDGYVTAVGTAGAQSSQINVASGQKLKSDGTSRINYGGNNLTVLASYLNNAAAQIIAVYVDDTGAIGTAAAVSPALPTVPLNATLLADISLPANATYLTQANITDRRAVLGTRQGSGTGGTAFAYSAPDANGALLSEIVGGAKTPAGAVTTPGQGGGAALVRTQGTDASVADAIGYKGISRNVKAVASVSGTTLSIAATGSNPVFLNYAYRWKNITATVSVNFTGLAAGRYAVYADISGTGLTWTLGFAAAPTFANSATQMLIAYVNYTGGASGTISDIDWTPIDYDVQIGQVRPKIPTGTGLYLGAYGITTTATIVPSANFAPLTYVAASPGLQITGVIKVLIRSGATADSFNVYAALNGGTQPSYFDTATVAASTYYTATVPFTLALAQGTNTISFAVNSGGATGAQVQGGYIVAQITGVA